MTDLLTTTSLTDPRPDPLKADFKVFLYVVWQALALPPPTRSQYELADWLQYGPKRLVIEAFRGIGKSWVTSAFVCWLLYCDPQLNILVVSASKDRADMFSTFTKRIINELPFLAVLRPNDGQRDSNIAFDVGPARASHSPSVKSVGITGQLTGSRADVIIADDVEVANNSATTTMRDALAERVKEFAAIIKPLDTSRIVFLGTPQTEMSMYNRLPDRGYEIRVLPAEYPNEAQRALYGNRLAQYLQDNLDRGLAHAGDPTCERFPTAVLMEARAEYGASGYALQFLLNTSLSDADRYPLKLRDLIVMDLDPYRGPIELAWGTDKDLIVEDVPNVGLPGDRYHRPFMVARDAWLPWQGIVMAVDPSGRGTDETGYAIVAMLHGRLFLLDAGGFTGGYDTATLEAIAKLAQTFRVNEIVVEPNFGDGMYTELLKPVVRAIYPCRVEESERAVIMKDQRIVDRLEPVMGQHRLVVSKSLIDRDFKSTEKQPPEMANRRRLFYQMTRVMRVKGSLAKYDRLDALAQAIHHWTERMAQSTKEAAEEARAVALKAELTKFMDNALHRKSGGSTVYRRSV